MNLVVERGMARCPSCVGLADYAFSEIGPDSMQYEIDCRCCGEVFRENTWPETLSLFSDPVTYSYTPWSERVRISPWVRATAVSHRCWGAAALAVSGAATTVSGVAAGAATAASGAVSAIRAKAADLPKRLPYNPLRELEAGPSPAAAV
jgi:hypothetical protein